MAVSSYRVGRASRRDLAVEVPRQLADRRAVVAGRRGRNGRGRESGCLQPCRAGTERRRRLNIYACDTANHSTAGTTIQASTTNTIAYTAKLYESSFGGLPQAPIVSNSAVIGCSVDNRIRRRATPAACIAAQASVAKTRPNTSVKTTAPSIPLNAHVKKARSAVTALDRIAPPTRNAGMPSCPPL